MISQMVKSFPIGRLEAFDDNHGDDLIIDNSNTKELRTKPTFDSTQGRGLRKEGREGPRLQNSCRS